MELCGGRLAGPLVALAEAVCVRNQNLAEFKDLLNRALEIDPDAKPEWRLVNLLMQRRARWLLSRADELFFLPDAVLIVASGSVPFGSHPRARPTVTASAR